MKTLDLGSIDSAARDVQRAQRAALAAEHLAQPGADPEEAGQAPQFAREAVRACEDALQRLLALGADLSRPGFVPARDQLPLHLLDTPASRRLLASLEAAAEAAAEVDRERGWVHEGEPCGYGETLQGLAATVRQEVEGPRGSGRE